MIKLKDLRPGNLVKYTGKPYSSYPLVDGIVEVEEVLRDGVNRSQGDLTLYESENLKGISLSPEWLERCGFEKDTRNVWLRRIDEYSLLGIYPDGKYEFIDITNGESVKSWDNRIEFVHQLQGFYLDHTGIELTIKETV